MFKTIVNWIKMFIGCPRQNAKSGNLNKAAHSVGKPIIAMNQIIVSKSTKDLSNSSPVSDLPIDDPPFPDSLDQFIADNTTIKEIIMKDDKKYESNSTKSYNIHNNSTSYKSMTTDHISDDRIPDDRISNDRILDNDMIRDILDSYNNYTSNQSANQPANHQIDLSDNQLDNYTLNNPDIYESSILDSPLDLPLDLPTDSPMEQLDQHLCAMDDITYEQTIPAEYDTPHIIKWPNDSLAALADLTAILKGEVVEPRPKKYTPNIKFEFRKPKIVLIPEHEVIYNKEFTERPIYAQFQHFTQESIDIRCRYCISRVDVILSRNSVYDERYIQLYKDYPICYFYTSPTGGAIYRVFLYGYIDDVAFAHVWSLENGRKNQHRIKVKYLVRQHEWNAEQLQKIKNYSQPGLFVDPMSIYDLIVNY